MTRLLAILFGVLLCAWPATGQDQRLAEIRVHGNYHTPDQEIVSLAGLAVGQAMAPSAVDDARARLERSGRFDAVEIRTRYRSLDLAGDVTLVIVVREHPTPEGSAELVPAPVRPLTRLFRSTMFLPILGYADGYGLTYGGRFSFVDGFGKDGRLSMPVTWGGTKRAAAEFEKSIRNAPIDRIAATLSISRQTNPHYRLDADRREATLMASRRFGAVRAGGHAGISSVGFAGVDTRLANYGVDVTLDTRADPVFPRNAIFATAGWDRLEVERGSGTSRVRLEARGYAGLVGQTVLSLRAHFARADRPLPPSERFLLGGADTLRGYAAGAFAGDTVAGATVELRAPISSPLSFGRLGIELFTDVGAATDHGAPIGAARFHSGFGGGVFFLASIFQINADLAHGRGGGVRLHVMSGFRF